MNAAQTERAAQHLERMAKQLREQRPDYSLKDMAAHAGIMLIIADTTIATAMELARFSHSEARKAVLNEGVQAFGD